MNFFLIFIIIFFFHSASPQNIFGEVSSITTNDKSGWVCGAAWIQADSPIQIWVSETTLYFVMISNGELSFSNYSIPDGMQTDVVLWALYLDGPEYYIYWIPRSNPTIMKLLYFYPPFISWSVLSEVTLEGNLPKNSPMMGIGVPNNIQWQAMIGETYGGANYFVYAVSLDYIALVQNNGTSSGITYITTVTIPQDDLFPVDTVVGAAYTAIADWISFGGPVFIARAIGGNPLKGGDIVTYNVTLTNYGIPTYDHTTYFLKGPQLAFAYGNPDLSRQNPYMVWSQSYGGEGLLYSYEWFGGMNNTPSIISFPFQANEQFGEVWILTQANDMAMMISYIPETPGFTIYEISLYGPYIEPIASLAVEGQYAPTVGLYAGDDQGDISGSVFGTVDANTGYNILTLYQFGNPNVVHSNKSARRQNVFEEMLFERELPPTCSWTPPCGPRVGYSCGNPPDQCYLDNKQIYCCAGRDLFNTNVNFPVCPDDC